MDDHEFKRAPIILISDPISDSASAILTKSAEVRFVNGQNRLELLESVKDIDALIIRSSTCVDEEVLNAARQLKIIGRVGVGVDNIDISEATARGVLVINAPTSNVHSACEHAIALLLAAARQIPSADNALRQGKWNRSSHTGVEIFGKTIGIVGFGKIGQLFAKRILAFETEVLVYDPYVPKQQEKLGVKFVELNELVSRSDFVTIHLPKNDETHNMFDSALLGKAKKGQILINAARGGIIDEEALAREILKGRIRGAGFDVYSIEPCVEYPLFKLPQVVVTPHLGASTYEAQDRAGLDVTESVLLALSGQEVSTAINQSEIKHPVYV